VKARFTSAWAFGAVWLVLIFLGQPIAHFLMYRERVLSHATAFQSDLIVFLLPCVIAFGATLYVLTYSRFIRTNVARAIGISAVLAASAWVLSMFLAINLYGA
jgi:tryptophan-rich sensory protein